MGAQKAPPREAQGSTRPWAHLLFPGGLNAPDNLEEGETEEPSREPPTRENLRAAEGISEKRYTHKKGGRGAHGGPNAPIGDNHRGTPILNKG